MARRRVCLLVVELVVGLFVIFLHVVHEPGDPVLLFHGQQFTRLNMRAMVAAAAPERKAATARPTTTT